MTPKTTVHHKPQEHELLGLVVNNVGRRAGEAAFTLALYYSSGGAPITEVELRGDSAYAAPKIGTRYRIHITEEVPNDI